MILEAYKTKNEKAINALAKSYNALDYSSRHIELLTKAKILVVI